jgi:hypothetical protein
MFAESASLVSCEIEDMARMVCEDGLAQRPMPAGIGIPMELMEDEQHE